MTDVKQMPEIQKIGEYLRNMQFKTKQFGGYDPKNVLDHFEAVTEKYESIIRSLVTQYGQCAQQNSALCAELTPLKQKNEDIVNRTAAIVRQYDSVIAAQNAKSDEQSRQLTALKAELDNKNKSQQLFELQNKKLSELLNAMLAKCHAEIENLSNLIQFSNKTMDDISAAWYSE